MPINPGADASLGGLGPALIGRGSEFTGTDSGTTPMVITAASSQAADVFVVRTNSPRGSTADGTARFVLNSSGEMKTSYMNVSALSSAAAQTVGSSLSGSILTYGPSSAAKTITLPAPVPGLNYIISGGQAATVGPTIVTSVGSTGSWMLVGDSAADGANLSSVLVNIPDLFCFAISSTKWVARELANGSSASFSSAAANGLAVSS